VSVQLNHTIDWCRDKQKSATFFTDVLGLQSTARCGPMLVVQLNNSVSLDFLLMTTRDMSAALGFFDKAVYACFGISFISASSKVTLFASPVED